MARLLSTTPSLTAHEEALAAALAPFARGDVPVDTTAVRAALEAWPIGAPVPPPDAVLPSVDRSVASDHHRRWDVVLWRTGDPRVWADATARGFVLGAAPSLLGVLPTGVGGDAGRLAQWWPKAAGAWIAHAAAAAAPIPGWTVLEDAVAWLPAKEQAHLLALLHQHAPQSLNVPWDARGARDGSVGAHRTAGEHARARVRVTVSVLVALLRHRDVVPDDQVPALLAWVMQSLPVEMRALMAQAVTEQRPSDLLPPPETIKSLADWDGWMRRYSALSVHRSAPGENPRAGAKEVVTTARAVAQSNLQMEQIAHTHIRRRVLSGGRTLLLNMRPDLVPELWAARPAEAKTVLRLPEAWASVTAALPPVRAASWMARVLQEACPALIDPTATTPTAWSAAVAAAPAWLQPAAIALAQVGSEQVFTMLALVLSRGAPGRGATVLEALLSRPTAPEQPTASPHSTCTPPPRPPLTGWDLLERRAPALRAAVERLILRAQAPAAASPTRTVRRL